MFIGVLERRIQSLLLFCVGTVTLVVTPWANQDPINLPKFFLLVIFSSALIGNLTPYLGKLIFSEARLLVIFALVFILVLLLSFFASGARLYSQLYGAYGRNTGLLTYLSLIVVLIGVVFVSSHAFIRKLLWTLIVTGIVNALYGLAQWTDLDLFNWDNPYNPIIGTFGNPNFLSAHLGIAALASISLLLGSGASLLARALLLLNVTLSLFVIYQSDSSQGLLIFAIGATVILYYRFVVGLKSSLSKYLYWGVVSGLSLVGLFGILNKGPLAAFLYQDSVNYRGDYWRAGWKMTLDNPLFGVGLDSYGDWYRFSRSQAAALRRGPDVISNSAHNVFLDISSSGGFFLLIAYLLILALVVRSAIRIVQRAKVFDAVGVALVSSWLAYQIQSVISINQLGLAIWGWALGGAIIGYDLYKDQHGLGRAKQNRAKPGEQVPPSIVLTAALGLVIGFLVAIWPVRQDISFRDALESGDAAKIERAADKFPRAAYYYFYTANILQENKLDQRALVIIKSAIKENPRDFNAWKLLAANSKVTESQRAAAIAKMRQLDPFNNTLGD